jgi:hypothetical protein
MRHIQPFMIQNPVYKDILFFYKHVNKTYFVDFFFLTFRQLKKLPGPLITKVKVKGKVVPVLN